MHPRKVVARCKPAHRGLWLPQSDHGRGLGNKHIVHKHTSKDGRTIGGPPPFHDGVPWHSAREQGGTHSQITLEVAFGTPFHFRCGLITFEVVPFAGGYDAVLGRTTFTYFMIIPNYAYMQIKMPGPHGVITIHGSHSKAILAEKVNLEEVKARGRQKKETHPQLESTRDII